MGEDEFWDAIGLLDWGRGGDDVTAVEPLLAHLAASSPTSSWAGAARASRAAGSATRTPSRGAPPRPPARASRSSCSPP